MTSCKFVMSQCHKTYSQTRTYPGEGGDEGGGEGGDKGEGEHGDEGGDIGKNDGGDISGEEGGDEGWWRGVVNWNVIATLTFSMHDLLSFVPLSATHVTAYVPRASDKDGEVLYAPKNGSPHNAKWERC